MKAERRTNRHDVQDITMSTDEVYISWSIALYPRHPLSTTNNTNNHKHIDNNLHLTMSDPSMPSSNTGPHFPGQGPKPHPEFTQHVHHHSLFHPRAQMPGLGPAGPAATTFQPGYGHGYGHWHGAQHYRRFRGPSRLIWVGRLALLT
jgi:hypothetical protein